MTYSVYCYLDGGISNRYYVINTKTKQIQSCWFTKLQADLVCQDLNKIDR